jgi:hypothetical protein
MFRKVSLSLLAAVLVAGALTAAPASAAAKVSNGVACSKVGAKTTSGGSKYVCAKNQLVKNSKLTWLSQECITLIDAYLKSKANLPKIKSQTDATVAKLAADLVVQKAEVEKANKLIAEYTTKIATIETALIPLKADTANLSKNKPTISKFEGAISSYKAAINAYKVVVTGLSRTQLAHDQAISGYEDAKIELSTGLSMANLICEKGF